MSLKYFLPLMDTAMNLDNKSDLLRAVVVVTVFLLLLCPIIFMATLSTTPIAFSNFFSRPMFSNRSNFYISSEVPSAFPSNSIVCASFRQFYLRFFVAVSKNNYPSLDGWKKHIDSRNPRIEKCDGILDNLVGSLDLPKVEKSPKGKVMMQAMYGVKVQIVFVYSVFAAAFLGSTKKLIDLDVAEIYTWVPEFKSLQNLVNEEVRVRFSSGRFPVLKELEAVDSAIKELYPIILNVVEPIETELDLKTVEQLGRATEKLSKGLDLLAKGVNGFFQVVLSGRDALLSNLRSGGIVYGRGSGGNIGVQAIN
ncbi:protein BPS1, chloroplastic-like [Arachis duranensis]|uniref:Protein BPS1, chloroplastic-like n=1 Tax=Arachis duranensis TaxID=130453 RepID=A0A9C6WL45_ARADU|nr:protein BPS1, chloroplastic-like [Arachis duranensis]